MEKTLFQEIVELETRKAQLETEKEQIEQEEAIDQDRLIGVINELNVISNRLSEKREVLDDMQESEKMLQSAIEENAYLMDNLVIGGLTMRELITDEQSYQLVKIAVQQFLDERAQANIQERADLKAKYRNEVQTLTDDNSAKAKQVEDLTYRLNAAETKVSDLTSDNVQLKIERDDYMSKLHHAADQLDEAKKEIARLNSEIDDLRIEKAVGARDAYKVISTGEQIAKALEAFKNSRVKVTNMRWEDELRKTHYLAEKADSGETIRFSHLEKGKYLEVSQEEAARFRAEASQSNHNDMALVEPTESVTETFPIPPVVEIAELGLDQTDAGVEVAGEEFVTKAEFEKLKTQVDHLYMLSGHTKPEAA